ncbi:acyl-CoA dehydrogenase [Mucilaginibacter lacusdianchii]|uniref:acyl-CoA dehydrogenase n=1 Tax=Mucilaginibacter lacusdianchii TaxID=2684211 RepID=UPI00131B7BA6|nr:acyl-CoA dehydrogenase [Mucilaginibacter sp. JXJ CY 39]
MLAIPHPSVLLQPEWVTVIRKNAFAAEQAGLLQSAQLELIYEQQWFKLLIPAAYGGVEMPLPDLVRLEEALAWADGSLGWVVTLCAGAGWFGGFIAPEAAQSIFADPRVCLAGSGADSGTATITDDGYVLNGSWKYASGVRHATHFTASCQIIDNNKPVMDSSGKPMILSFVIDKDAASLVPAWKYIGMMGTGSHAFTLHDAGVSANRSFKINAEDTLIDGPLYRYPFLQLAEATLAANLSGMAIHFADLCEPIFHEKLKQKRLTDVHREVLLNTLQGVRENIQAMRDNFYQALDASWQAMETSHHIEDVQLQAVSRASRLLAQIARESVDTLYPYCGLQAASPDTEINQVWRDLHTAGQHALLTFSE